MVKVKVHNIPVRTPFLRRRDLLALPAALPVMASAQTVRGGGGFVDIGRVPDAAIAHLESGQLALTREGRRWTGAGIAVQTEPSADGMPVRIEAPEAALLRLQLRWRGAVPESWRILNDQWERSYGDLEWRGMVGERVLPWYFLAFDGRETHGYGVATGGSSSRSGRWIRTAFRCGWICGTAALRCVWARGRWRRRWCESGAGQRTRALFKPRGSFAGNFAPSLGFRLRRCMAGITGITRTAATARRKRSCATRA